MWPHILVRVVAINLDDTFVAHLNSVWPGRSQVGGATHGRPDHQVPGRAQGPALSQLLAASLTVTMEPIEPFVDPRPKPRFWLTARVESISARKSSSSRRTSPPATA